MWIETDLESVFRQLEGWKLGEHLDKGWVIGPNQRASPRSWAGILCSFLIDGAVGPAHHMLWTACSSVSARCVTSVTALGRQDSRRD